MNRVKLQMGLIDKANAARDVEKESLVREWRSCSMLLISTPTPTLSFQEPPRPEAPLGADVRDSFGAPDTLDDVPAR